MGEFRGTLNNTHHLPLSKANLSYLSNPDFFKKKITIIQIHSF